MMNPPHLVDPDQRAMGGRNGRPHASWPPLAAAEGHLAGGRYREALLCTSRLQRRGRCVGETAARGRVVRAGALWALGLEARARAEALRALDLAETGGTRRGARSLLSQLAWRAGDLSGALTHLEQAQLDGDGHDTAALLGLRSQVLRDAGRPDEALATLDQALATAVEQGLPEHEAELRAERATLLGVLGRWAEARDEVENSARLYRERGDPREHSVAGLARGVLDLSTGELAGARAALERARAVLASHRESPRGMPHTLLSLSDLHLAAGDAELAERCAQEALARFSALRERRGVCWSRLRRAHALLALARRDEALLEARRAVREASGWRLAVEAWAQLTLGRVLLHVDRPRAAEAFARARECPSGRRDLALAARLGSALSRGAEPGDAELREALEGLALFGDRRILALGLADARALVGSLPAPTAPALSARAAVVAVPREASLLVDAARSLAGAGSFEERWAAAQRAVRGQLPWWRAALVADPGLELREDLSAPQPLAADDLARRVASEVTGPGFVRLDAHPGLAEHPTRALHGLSLAAVAPVAPGVSAYADFRELDDPERATALLAELARLLAAHLEPAAAPAVLQTPAPLPGMIGRCPAIRGLQTEIARVADTSLSVHIEGETGTGKERVARALHEASGRSRGRFVAVNASTLNDELFESELFGHVRGAFTGAVANRDGYVAEAEGGTLFLDEVADLSPRGQAKLLRFIQEREYRRVGESVLRKADVRILTAANARLEQRVAAGLFREDLMYRLTAFTLRLPPLRERGGDVILLARYFLERAAQREGRPPARLGSEVARLLSSHAWPGNVRELEQAMDRAALLAAGERVGPEHLPARVLGAAPRQGHGSLREELLACERQALVRALEETGGNRARAAVALGITRQALLLKLRRLGLG